VKSDNKYLAEIIEKSSKYSSEYNKFKRLFIKNKNAFALSEHQFWDHEILLEFDKKLTYESIYSLSKKELKILQKYLNEN